jgi:hypothetical protein
MRRCVNTMLPEGCIVAEHAEVLLSPGTITVRQS